MKEYKHRATKNYNTLIVTFSNGRTINYTNNILALLLTDKSVVRIVNADTGEIIKG